MKLITKVGKAQRAADHWYKCYSSDGSYWEGSGYNDKRTRKEIHSQLLDLGTHPSPDEVEAVIGNKSWTDCTCHECGKSVDELVQIGQELDYESMTAEVCFPCLKKAVKMK